MVFTLFLITVIFIILLMVIGAVSVFGWMISDERYKKEVLRNRKNEQDIEFLKKRVRRLNGELNINTATRYSEQGEVDKNEH